MRDRKASSVVTEVQIAADISKLVELAYAAAVDDELWRDWTNELIHELDSPGALFWVIDPSAFEMCRDYMCFRDRDNDHISREYLSGPVADDPQMHRVCSVDRSEIYLDVHHVDVENARTKEYLGWQESNCGTRHHITASVMLPDGLKAGVSVHRTASQGVPDEALRRSMRAIFPHFARALRLGFRHSEALQATWWDGVSSGQTKAFVLLDNEGRVLRTTSAADNVFRRNDGLTVSSDFLKCNDAANDQELRGAIARAVERVTPVASGVSVRRANAPRPYNVTVYPLIARQRFLAPHGAAALLTIYDPSAGAVGLPPHCKKMLNLTLREGEVVDLLLAGHSLASLAACLGISGETARSHLRSIFSKTHTSRQAELLTFLTRLN